MTNCKSKKRGMSIKGGAKTKAKALTKMPRKGRSKMA